MARTRKHPYLVPSRPHRILAAPDLKFDQSPNGVRGPLLDWVGDAFHDDFDEDIPVKLKRIDKKESRLAIALKNVVYVKKMTGERASHHREQSR